MSHRAGWVVAAVVLALAAPALWRDDRESFRTTWEAVAAGGEAIPLHGAVTVWDEEAGTLAAWPAASLAPARLSGASAFRTSYFLFVAALALVWAGGIQRLGRALGAGEAAAWAASIPGALLPVVVADGRLAILGAGPALWLVDALLRERGALAVLAPWLALAALSRGAFLLSLPLVIAARCLRPGRSEVAVWLPVAVAVALYLGFPEPAWSRFLRFPASYYFAEGAYAPEARGAGAAILFPFTGDRAGASLVLGALLLWSATVAGAWRAGRDGGRMLIVAAVLIAVTLGTMPFPFPGAREVAGPAPFLAALVPEMRFQPFPAVAGALAGACLLALAARALLPAAVGLVFVAVGLGSRAEPAPLAPAPPAIASAIAAGEGDVLALPLSIGNDRRWRRALPAETKLRNGLQETIARNAPLLAAEMDARDPAGLREILARLAVERVVVPSAQAPALGEVLVSAGGESLVRVRPSSSRQPPCLRGHWDVRASTGAPEVSVARRAVDGDRATRWGTGAPQRPGQFFEIDFGEERVLAAIELDLGEFRTDYPRGLRAAVSRDGGSWSTVFVREPWLGEVAWADGFAFHDGGESGRVQIPLGGVAARRVRLEQTRTTALYDWSIAEICVRGE